jgi:hypothetical protein
MATLVCGARPKRRAESRSVREVSLLGIDRAQPRWESGNHVAIRGRLYQVTAIDWGMARGGMSRGYVYLEATRGGEPVA